MHTIDPEHDEIDALDANEIQAEMMATQYDDDPNVYDGTYSEAGDFGDDW